MLQYRCTTRSRRVFVGALLIALGGVCAARVTLASFPFQDTTLSGPDIAGNIPGGTAQVNQVAQPNGPGRLAVQVTNVALADGTPLNVTLDRRPMGVITLKKDGTGALTASVPFQVGRLTSITVTNGNTTVLTGKAPWVVPWPTTP